MKPLWAAALACAALPAFGYEMADFAVGAEIVVLGEIHDNPEHHARQAELIGQIGPAAVVFEMLTPEQATLINTMGRADPEALDWAGSGWPDFRLYAPVFAATEGLSHYGAMLPRALVRRAFDAPPEQLFAEIWQGDGPPPDFGLADPLPEAEQAEREAGQMASHCDALPPETLPGVVAAQRLRDAALAGEALRALDETGGPVVVIAGNGHAREDWGVPALLARLPDAPRVASLGQFEEGAAEAGAPFDATALSPPTPRDDPCRAFRD